MLLRTAPILLLLTPFTASAATRNVCSACTYTTVKAAVDAASAGDTIAIAAGSYNENTQIDIDKNLTITGAGSGTTTITRSSGASAWYGDLLEVTAGTVTISGLTLEPRGTYSYTSRGLDISGGANVTASDLKIATHEADINGAGIRVNDSTLTLSSSTFDDVDSTSGVGGAMYVDDSTITLTGVTFQGCDAEANDSGAIEASQSTVDITGSTFTDNSAAGGGGAIYAYYAAVSVSSSAFTGNAAGTYGGDIRLNTSSLSVLGSTFTDSYAPTEGGSIAIRNGSSATIDGSAFSGGSSGLGGHVLAYGALELTDSTFYDGVATSAGGHVYLWSEGDADAWSIEGSSFELGSAPSGGAIYATGDGSLTLSDSELLTNSASASGGGIYLTGLGTADVQRNRLCDNTATSQGGGAWLGALSTGDTHLFTNNVLVENDGATGANLYVDAATTLDVLNNDLLGGAAGSASGGGGYAVSDLDFDNNLVAYVTAGDGLVGSGTSAGIATYGAWYSNTAANASGTVTLDGTNVTGSSPLLYEYAPGDACDAEWFGYQYTSPLKNAGDTGVFDLDGTRADIGAAGGPYADPAYWDDLDGDGYDAVYDCDDALADVRPGAAETCNDRDDDCDGAIDDGITWYADADGDGFGDAAAPSTACPQPTGYVADATDCDDTDAAIHPTAAEVCNEADDDCDGAVDEGVELTFYADTDSDGYGDPAVTDAACAAPSGYVADATDCSDASVDDGVTSTFFRDADSDGYGDPAVTDAACAAPSGYTADNTDCDDTSATISPAGTEVCNEADDDCDGAVDEGVQTTFYADADSDGYGTSAVTTDACAAPGGYVADATDCDDALAGVNPAATETCDDVDQDCDGAVDDGAIDPTSWYADADGDGYGDPGAVSAACDAPADHVANADDCDDGDANVRPGAAEQCNGEDDDCDGAADEEEDLTFTDWYADADADGFGEAGSAPTNDCAAPSGTVDNDGDCADDDADVNPSMAEVCNGKDDDCDGTIDVDAADPTTWFSDADGDGVGDPNVFLESCDAPDGYVADEGDCDDTNASVSPVANECANGYDDDCDGAVDEDVVETTWYADADGDGFGTDVDPLVACEQPDGYAAEPGDCDDADGEAFPGAEEVWYDGIDQACDGGSDYDQDADGHDALDHDGDDCDDLDASVSPTAEEVEGNDVDENCDGSLGDPDPPELSDRPWEAGDTGAGELAGSGCGCDTGSGPSAAWLALVGLAAVVRRRR